MWYRMMAVAFVANGLCAFGARVLQDMGLAETHSALYLSFWYSAGLVISVIGFVVSGPRVGRADLVIGALMGCFSALGWVFMTQAIARGLPGYLVFPIAIGGNLSIVAAVGVLLFHERLSPYGYLGILTGITGLVLMVIG